MGLAAASARALQNPVGLPIFCVRVCQDLTRLWTRAETVTVAEPLDQLRSEHANTRTLMALLDDQAEIIASGATPDYELLEGIAEYCLDYPQLHHHPLEDAIYRQLLVCSPDTARSVGDLEGDHHALFDLARQFADTVRNLQADALLPREEVVREIHAFARQYREHMAQEESGLFEAAERCLSAEDWERLAEQVDSGRDPLFNDTTRRAYEAIRRAVLGARSDPGE